MSAATIADFIGLTDERVRQLAGEGVIPRHGRGKFPLRSSVRAYEAWARDEARKSTSAAHQSRVGDARAREIELRIAEREGKLIETDLAFAIVDDVVGAYRAAYAGIATRITRDIPLRRKIEAEIVEAQSRVSKVLADKAAAVRAEQ